MVIHQLNNMITEEYLPLHFVNMALESTHDTES